MSENDEADGKWATDDELSEFKERDLNNQWEMWFKMVASNYPEIESADDYS